MWEDFVEFLRTLLFAVTAIGIGVIFLTTIDDIRFVLKERKKKK